MKTVIGQKRTFLPYHTFEPMLALDEPSERFRLEPFGTKPRGYFVTPELNQRLNLIRHLIQNSEQLLLVLADLGCGKTSLLNQIKKIASKQYEHWWIYTLNSNPALSPEVLISTLLSTFNVRQEGKPTQVLQESLRNHIASMRYSGKLPILFVDDAHKLPLATLKFIVDFAMQGESLTRMRVILFCEPQITSILATHEFEIVHNTLIHTLDIPPFSKLQTRDYIQFRLEGSKYHPVHPFNSETLKKIYLESEGIPGEINLYAQEVLSKFSEQRHLLSTSLSYSKLVWGIPIVILFLGTALLVYWYYPHFFHAETYTNQTFPSKQILSTQTTFPETTSPSPTMSPHPSLPVKTYASSLPVSNPQLPSLPKEKLSPPFEQFPVLTGTTELLKSPSYQKQDHAILPYHPTTLAEQVSLSSQEDLMAPKTFPILPEVKKESKTTSSRETPISSEFKTPVVTENIPAVPHDPFLKGEQWLRYQNPHAYTLQILGAYDKGTLEKFLTQHSLSSQKVAMFKTIFNHKEWYVLVYGVFPNRTEAIAALEALPDPLKQTTQPWVRTLGNVQKLIKGKNQ